MVHRCVFFVFSDGFTNAGPKAGRSEWKRAGNSKNLACVKNRGTPVRMVVLQVSPQKKQGNQDSLKTDNYCGWTKSCTWRNYGKTWFVCPGSSETIFFLSSVVREAEFVHSALGRKVDPFCWLKANATSFSFGPWVTCGETEWLGEPEAISHSTYINIYIYIHIIIYIYI